MDRLSIFRKGLLLIAIPLLFQLVFIGLVALMRQTNNEAERWTIHSNEVIAQVESCGYRILSAHGAVQGYFITREPAFGAETHRLVAISKTKLEELVNLVADNQSQMEIARKVRSSGLALLAYIEGAVTLIEGPGLSPEAAKNRRLGAQTLLEDLRSEMSRFVVAEQELRDSRHRKLDAAWQWLDRLLLSGTVVSILASFLIAILFSRSVSGRIENLARNARLLSDGQELTAPLRGSDEIARLDSVFRQMARTLETASRRERADAVTASRLAEETAAINAQLREKAQENEMFVYSVSHDLRSPLVNLQGFSKELGLIGKDLIRAVDRDGVPEEIRRQTRALVHTEMGESIGFIQSAVTRLSGIIDALLRLSRVGRVEYRAQMVEVQPIVERVVSALRGTIDQRQARVIVEDLPPAFADPTAIEQVLANLIGNAVNYLDPDRPGLVTVSATLGEASPEASEKESTVVYSVADNGLGIPESYHSKIFTAFQRLHGDVAKGEGIGLALVRRIVERNGGRVWFESRAGQGTTFAFAMPAGPNSVGTDLRDDVGTPVAGLKESV